MSARIMVVDDSMMIRQQVGRTLTQAGFSVVDAVDGEDAYKKLASLTDISLLVCDVNMPRMSGIELLEKLKNESRLTKTNVVMLTTEGQSEMVQRAKALGAKGWIIKPFKPELLVAAAKKLTATAP